MGSMTGQCIKRLKIDSKLLSFLILSISLTFHTTWSQKISETGLPYIQNYFPADYNAASQNWSIVQSKEGFIYLGNNNGVLEYDGVSWRTIALPNLNRCASLGITEGNKIYVGGQNELGYLEPNSSGQLQFTSLKYKLDDDFQYVRDISITKDAVYFITPKKLFAWQDDQFKVYNTEGRFNLSKTIQNEAFVVENKTVVKKVKEKRIETVTDFSEINTTITDLLSYKENELLILTYNKGVFITQKGKIKPLNTKTSKFLEKALARKIIKLSNGWYSIATSKNGIITIDETGSIIKVVTKTLGLADNTVFQLLEDQQKGIWTATNNGISRVELISPYSIFDDRHGIEGYVNDIYKYKNKVYLANYHGVLRLDTHKTMEYHNYYETVSPIVSITETSSKQAIQFLELNDTLFVGTRGGLYIFADHKLVQQFKLESGALFRSKKNPEKIYVGLINGLASMVYKNGKWQNEGRIEGIQDDIRKIEEDLDGNLWLESQNDGVWKVEAKSLMHLDSLSLPHPKVRHYKANKELPEGFLFLRSINNQVLFNIDNDLYSYDKKQDSILKDSSIGKLFELPGEISLKMEDKESNVWMFAQLKKEDKRRSRIIALKQKNGAYIIQKNADERITQDVGVAHFPDDDNVVWYGGSGGVIRHDLNIAGNDTIDFNSHIRKVTIQNDSVLFGGNKKVKKITSIPFKGNAIRFEYAATSFDDESKNQFQYILEGFDEDWSPWTSETKKDYTNIPEGDYSFKIRSKNVFNHVGNAASYSFAVLPPWYRTWWAYLIYALGAMGIVVLYSKWRSNELQKKNMVLENTINKRTLEIRQKNELLNHQTEQLVQLNDSKTRLYSNITHEFRTPLTVILGMADTLKINVKNESFEEAGKSLEMIRRNGKNLLHLVNEMLDLAKVESGSMELNLVQTDAIPFVKYLSESFHSLAESKKINLTVYSEIDTLEMDIDVNKMASIISNLLSNAIKFTSDNGKIIVHLNKIERKGSEVFSIKVQDNGFGIPEDDIVHLFDRFYQGNSSTQQKGTGIGLSLTKEFVELMNGSITVESTTGKGSTFIVQIPVTNNAIKTEEAKVTIEPPIKAVVPSIKKELSFEENTSELPLVLIIEDNEDVAHYLETCLKANYRTIHALDGNTGLKMAFENIPDIIISDVMMPGKDGLEVCATLKADERTDHIPVILLTAKVTKEDRLTGLTHGADAYLAKPFHQDELFTRLDQLILVRKKLIRKLEKNGLSSLLKEKVENPQTKFLKQVIESIHSHLDDANFGPTQLAKEICLSESQIYRKLKSITDKSTAIFIRSVRLQKAKELIETTNKTISEIAYETGFNDPSWFSRAFKKEFNLAPSDIHK